MAVLRERDERAVQLVVLKQGDFFGDVPFFERGKNGGNMVRATVRAIGTVRVLTVDRKTMLKRIHDDPSLAYRILQLMSKRMQDMEDEIARLVIGG